MQLRAPPVGLTWLPTFAQDILRLFKSKLDDVFRLWTAPTANLPTAAPELAGATAYDSTLDSFTFCDGTDWQTPALAGHVHAAADVTFAPAGNIAATNVQAAIVELDGEKLAASSYTASDVLTKLLTVDGAGTGLDADLLDAQTGAFYLARANHTGTQTAATISDFSTAADARITAAVGVSVQAFDAATTKNAAAQTLTNKTFALGSNTLSGTLAEFNAALTGADFATGGGTATGTNTGDQTSITGNAGTATTLQNARNFSISGGGVSAPAVSFNGSGNVVLVPTLGAITPTSVTASGVVAGTELKTGTGGGVDIRDRDNLSLQWYLYGNAGILRFFRGADVLTLTTTGLDMPGEVRCDSLRIDASPTAAAVAQTHHVPININGTTYKLLLAS